MSTATIQDLLAYLSSPSVMRPDLTTVQASPTYPSETDIPTADQLRTLKEQLSVDVWLWLMRSDKIGLPVDEMLVQRELQAHLARVLDLVGQDLRHEPLSSAQVRLRLQWVQYQLLHAPAEQAPRVYYEQAARELVTQAQHQQAQEQAWHSLSPEQQAPYQQALNQRPNSMRPSANVISAPIPMVPRTGFSGGIQHPGFGEWLIQELAQRPLPEIEPYLTLTWVFVKPDSPRRAGEMRRTFTEADISYLLDLLDSDWSYLTTAGRPQFIRARDWFARQLITATRSTLSQRPELTAQRIALICIYQEEKISPRKAEQLATQAPTTSGKKIYNKYRQLVVEIDRLNVQGKKRTHLINDIEAILVHLTGPAKKRAENELFKLR